MMFHPWHDLEKGDLFPKTVQAVVEIPRGSRAKYEIDKPSGLIRLDRVLVGSMVYPVHYGIIPKTLFDDGDPLDILVFTRETLPPLTLVSVRIIGVMRMIDQGVADDKIMAIVPSDPSVSHIKTVSDLPEHTLTELRHFFENYTQLEGKSVQVPAFLPESEAWQTLTYSADLYEKKFGK